MSTIIHIASRKLYFTIFAALMSIPSVVISMAMLTFPGSGWIQRRVPSVEAIGRSWQEGDQIAEKLAQVTPEQIQAVARKYLVDSNLTVAVLDPLPIDKAKRPRAPRTGGGHVR